MVGDYPADQYILVLNAAQLLLEPLTDALGHFPEAHADVHLLSHRYGMPSGMMAIRCGTLMDLASTGYFDLKEQALPRLAQRHAVKVAQREQPPALPVRTRRDYIQALKWQYGDCAFQAHEPLSEDWAATFSLVEPRAEVADSAFVHDSVVLNGAHVEKDAVLIRSVVGPGGVIRRGETAQDLIIGPGGHKEA
jgi:NDP-sugar pyrophosphorylase family protein